MKRTVVRALACALVLNACSAIQFPEQPTVAPAVDRQATEAAIAATLAAETLNTLPTPTLVLAVDTLTPTATETEFPSATATSTENPAPGSATATMVTETVTNDSLPTTTQAVATASETLHPRFYGTLPPAIPFGKVKLINKAKADVYISLQCTTIDGYKTIIEYPVFGSFSVSAPAGRYNYVAWVGGREFQGSFRLDKGEDLAITFNKDKVSLK